jgi:hypothetical protein
MWLFVAYHTLRWAGCGTFRPHVALPHLYVAYYSPARTQRTSANYNSPAT